MAENINQDIKKLPLDRILIRNGYYFTIKKKVLKTIK